MNIAAISAADHRPAYVQIAEGLRARILSGFYIDRIAGELPLAREWNVSRRTIQQAIEMLAEEGLLVRQHGAGTFINRRNVDKRYRAITSITEGIARQGLVPEFTVLASGPAVPNEDEQAFFALERGEPVYRHHRLIAAKGRPLAVALTTLNSSLMPDLELSKLDASLYRTLRAEWGRTVVSAEDRYLPTIADKETAELLSIGAGQPIFEALRRAWDQTGAPIEFSVIKILPVPLEISIRHVGFASPADDPASEWTHGVGFGDFPF